MAPKTTELVHASAVACGTTGLLIRGKSGSGKSALAIELVARGAELVSDDQVHVTCKDDGLLMSAPAALANRIEARGLGILGAATRPAWARYVVDLDVPETKRLPEPQETVIAGVALSLVRRVESPAFPSMLYVLMKGGFA